MPTPALPLAALLFGTLGLPDSPAELPATAVVVVDSLAPYVEPDVAAVATGRLRRGEMVRVLDADPASGWLTIEPPTLSFDWVERSAVRDEGDGTGRIVAVRAVVRAGVPQARMPGPPRVELTRGTPVRLLKRPPLVVGTGPGATVWTAIVPPSGEVRYVPADGVAWLTSRAPTGPPESPREIRASYDPGPKTGGGSPFPPEVAAEVSRIEAEHRALLGEPVENWRLDAVRARYEGLVKRVTEPGASAALRDRLDTVARHEEMARSARTFQTLLDRSRRRDMDVALTKRKLADLDRARRRPFVAEGLVQATSREVDGRRVYAMIGPRGTPIAYLDVPPGLDARPVLARRAGVRGGVHYNESLGARLITVRDLEPLE